MMVSSFFLQSEQMASDGNPLLAKQSLTPNTVDETFPHEELDFGKCINLPDPITFKNPPFLLNGKSVGTFKIKFTTGVESPGIFITIVGSHRKGNSLDFQPNFQGKI